jgi:hypothetical protein
VEGFGGNGYRDLYCVQYCNLIVFTFTISIKSIDMKTVTLQILLARVDTKVDFFLFRKIRN